MKINKRSESMESSFCEDYRSAMLAFGRLSIGMDYGIFTYLVSQPSAPSAFYNSLPEGNPAEGTPERWFQRLHEDFVAYLLLCWTLSIMPISLILPCVLH